jgi:hypothetical protein
MTIVEPGARHSRPNTDPLDAPTVRIVLPPQRPLDQTKTPVPRSRGWKLVRRLLLISAAAFGALIVLVVILAITVGPSVPAPTPAAAPAASSAPASVPAAPAPAAAPAPVAPPVAAPVTPAPAAPPAAASPAAPAPSDTAQQPAIQDAAFLLALDNQGISYASPDAAINVGHTVCTAYEGGSTTLQIATAMDGHGYSADQEGFIIGAAASAYCPAYAPNGG